MSSIEDIRYSEASKEIEVLIAGEWQAKIDVNPMIENAYDPLVETRMFLTYNEEVMPPEPAVLGVEVNRQGTGWGDGGSVDFPEMIYDKFHEIESEIAGLDSAISDNEDCGCGGNVYPPVPSQSDEQGEAGSGISKVCGAAWYIYQQLDSLIGEQSTNGPESDLASWLLQYLSASGFSGTALRLVYDFWFENQESDLYSEISGQNTAIIEWLFCNGLDREGLIGYVDELDLSDGAKEALVKTLQSINSSLWEQWIFVGSETRVEDCSGMCSWKVVWVFAEGSYTPDDSEDAIYHGNNWNVYEGTFDDMAGYTGLMDVWGIAHELPPDCKVVSMVHGVNKSSDCASVAIRVTWRGTSGEDTPDFSPPATVISDSPIAQNWTMFSAELSGMNIQHNNFLCDNDIFASQTKYVVMVGTGSMPSA